jgi:hypothetical protein
VQSFAPIFLGGDAGEMPNPPVTFARPRSSHPLEPRASRLARSKRVDMKVVKSALITVVLGSVLAAVPFSRAADTDAKPADGQPAARPRGPVRDRLQQMSEQLKLTDEQKAKLKPILKEQAVKARELRDNKDLSREDRMAKVKEIREGLVEKVKPILTPEQLEKWNKLRSEGPGRRKQE